MNREGADFGLTQVDTCLPIHEVLPRDTHRCPTCHRSTFRLNRTHHRNQHIAEARGDNPFPRSSGNPVQTCRVDRTSGIKPCRRTIRIRDRHGEGNRGDNLSAARGCHGCQPIATQEQHASRFLTAEVDRRSGNEVLSMHRHHGTTRHRTHRRTNPGHHHCGERHSKTHHLCRTLGCTVTDTVADAVLTEVACVRSVDHSVRVRDMRCHPDASVVIAQATMRG